MSGGHACIEHFRSWLQKGMTACGFANVIASKGRVNYDVRLEMLAKEDVAGIDSFIDSAAQESNFAVILFPRVRTTEEITHLLRTLASGERWKIKPVSWNKSPREGASLIGVMFKTTNLDQSSVMGFAPLGCMPVTRRAPYVALAVWAGSRLNKHRESPKGSIGFIDAPPVDRYGQELAKEAHDSVWETTRARVKSLLVDPPEERLKLKDVAFCLPEKDVAELFPGEEGPQQPPAASSG